MARNNGHTQAFNEITQAVVDNSAEIIKRINFPGSKKIVFDGYGQTRVRGGNGKTTVAKCTGKYRLNSEGSPEAHEITFFTKFYKGENGNTNGKKINDLDYVKRPEDPWSYEYEVYALLRQSGMVPEAFLFGDIKGLEDKLITLPAGDQELEKKIHEINENSSDFLEAADKQLELMLEVVSSQAFLDDYLEKEVVGKLIGSDNRVARNIKRPDPGVIFGLSIKKALNYLRGGLEKDSVDDIPRSLRAEYLESIHPILEVLSYNKSELIHGALDGENIIGNSKESWQGPSLKTREIGNIKYIDLESLRFGHPFNDTSSIVTTPGMYLRPEHWEKLMNRYREVRLRLMGVEPRKGIFAMMGASEAKINEDYIRAGRGIFYSGAFFNPFKIEVKYKDMKRLFPDAYEAMLQEKNISEKTLYKSLGKFMDTSLEYVLSNPDQFIPKSRIIDFKGFSDRSFRSLENLRIICKNEGLTKK